MDERIINNIKSLGIDMIEKAGSGHPGIVLSAAPLIYTVYANYLNINKDDQNWMNRDRFVLSAGHGSALLYATLYMAGYLSLDDLKKFRQIGSITSGHPEYGVTPGVEMSTGPLGQGFASAVGMAMAEKHLEAKYPKLFNYKVYVICGDGDLMEGISYEASSLAGTLKLNNLIVLYDSNSICLDGETDKTFNDDVPLRFKSLGWNVIEVDSDYKKIDKALGDAQDSDKPVLIKVKTVIGEGSYLEGTNKVHGSPLAEDDYKQLKEKLGFATPFEVDMDAKKYFEDKISSRTTVKYNEFLDNYEKYADKDLEYFKHGRVSYSIDKSDFEVKDVQSTRDSSGMVLNHLASQIPSLFGGSADLSSSTKTYLKDMGDFSYLNYFGRNIWFGVREHAMGAILNGLALSGFRSFGSTFFAFSDYVKPAMRLSAFMDLPVTYIFTHDSINIGMDGPTHQPIEQLAALRSMPNMTVYRPADLNEVIGAYENILDRKKPSTLVLARMATPNLKETDVSLVSKGAYVVLKEKGELKAILIATGTEVSLAMDVASKLGAGIRVVSMPSMELFEEQSDDYKNEVLPKAQTFFIEAGSSYGLRKYASDDDHLITIDRFGASGSTDDVLDCMDFSLEKVYERIKKVL